MHARSMAALGMAALTAFSLTACGSEEEASAGGGYDASQPVPGSDQGSHDASAEEIKAALEQDAWWYPSQFVDCASDDTDPSGCNGPSTDGVYNAIPADLATEPWRVCAVLPHVKDPYWVATDYGLVTEAERLGIELDIYEAGGYTELANQLNQIDDCVAAGAQAVIIGAISFDGLDAKIDQLRDQDIVVVDGLNGISNESVDARAVLAWTEMGGAVGDYLAEQDEAGKVAWFPGPAGAGWAEDATTGIEEALKGSATRIVDTKYGDTDKNVQLRLVEDTVQANPDVTVIAGTAVTAEAAATADIGDRIILADYMIPSTFDLIESGDVTCGVSDQPVIQARMTVDMVVRLLQGIPLDDDMQRAFPAPVRVCGPSAGDAENISDFIPETTFAPEGWSPVFSVGS
ncbi:MAG: reductase system periplasmic protein TorT [Blastococcus sp.]|jgi:protein TorT|nr:reductase system periplasmic protein TorT [Blastococcus sp.]